MTPINLIRFIRAGSVLLIIFVLYLAYEDGFGDLVEPQGN